MPPATTLGLFILVVAVLPGSVYTWAYERQASAFGASFTDRTLRFVAVSMCFQLVLAWPEYGAYRFAAASTHGFGAGEFGVLWAVLAILIFVPLGFGTALGGLYATRTTREGWRWIRRFLSADMEMRLLSLLLGRTPAPRAWDHFFSERPTAYLLIRLLDGRWVAGRFADLSYAGGFPHDQDLFLEEEWAVDQETGQLVGDTGLGSPLYVPGGQVQLIEVIPYRQCEEAGGERRG